MQKREGVNTPSLPHSDGPGKTVLEAVSSVRATWGTCFLPLQSPAASPFHPGREKKQANGRGAGASRTRTETVASGKRWGRGSKRHLRETRGHSRSHRAGGAGCAHPQPQGRGEHTPSATGPGGAHTLSHRAGWGARTLSRRAGGRAHPQPQGRGEHTLSHRARGGHRAGGSAQPQPQGRGARTLSHRARGERTASPSATGLGEGSTPSATGPGTD